MPTVFTWGANVDKMPSCPRSTAAVGQDAILSYTQRQQLDLWTNQRSLYLRETRKERYGEMEDPRTLLGVCGLYCGACYHYRASLPESEHLLEEAARQGRELEGYTCRGCRSDTLYIHAGCSTCEIRTCADGRGLVHCGLCRDFPCDRIEAFQSDGRVHHRDVIDNLKELKAKQPEQWLAEQAQRWRCQCGAEFSWYEESCHACGAPLASYADFSTPLPRK